MTFLSTMGNTEETLEVSNWTLERKRTESNENRRRDQKNRLTKSFIEGTTNEAGTRLRYRWPECNP